jgi:hypothetical protein
MVEKNKIYSHYIGEGLVFQPFPHFSMLKNSSMNQPLGHSLFLNVQVHLLIISCFSMLEFLLIIPCVLMLEFSNTNMHRMIKKSA